MRLRALGLLATIALPLHSPVPEIAAQTQQGVSGRSAVVAGILLAATLAGDQGLRGEFQEHRGNGSNSIAKVANTFGDPHHVLPVLGVGYLVGRLSGLRTLEQAATQASGAAAVAGGLTMVLKFTFGRGRPDHGTDADPDRFRPFSRWSSFPSGHTAMAFAVATAVAHETPDRWSDVALYGAATLTGLARLNDDRHWTSDVLAGALVGHLSARWLVRDRRRWMVAPGVLAVSFEF